MTPQRRGRLELVVAAVAAVGCVLSWLAARSFVQVAPVMEGEPSTTSVAFSPPLLLLALIAATVAGVMAVLGTARLRRVRAYSVAPRAYTP
ncbi:hypothetical protein [Mycolicibacterium confluentis]|uniref:Uncharacterized protein n=1 Tax=Mycolicibacterium confluentis TaxID=28047 RepID=A0A7I7Y1G5_9MYCO|nr:hypothetical protein [Mycolicibacterium confluentis]MCV7320370.1 hypothetical protein [Mycolicibacterium confluentis]ORV21905.1 hypothetical protein AWB99_06070 [Mycolicibacterium confluentis]BBZ35409.1 hypothetical protein MCNF_40140 [Mycolicibacterium confluentis]